MGVSERIHVTFERLRRAAGAAARMPFAVPRLADGSSATGADFLREVDGLRWKNRLYSHVAAEPAAVYALLGTVVLAVFLAFLALTDAGRAFAAVLPESPSAQISTFVIAPLLAFLGIRGLGRGVILHAAEARSRLTLSCPHCEQAMSIQAPWECPYCAGRNEPASFNSVLDGCGVCGRDPGGCYCDKCGWKVALRRDVARSGGDDFPCAKPIGWAPPAARIASAGGGGGAGQRPEVIIRQGPATDGGSLPVHEDPRHELIEAFGLSETASTEDIEAAFEDSKDSDAKSYLSPDKEALEQAAHREAWHVEPQVQTPRQPATPDGDDEAAAIARQRIIMHLGADTRASWAELQDYFDQADSDTQATMNPDDAGRLRRMADAEKRRGIRLS